MKHAFILIGASGSGKTTVRNRIVEQHKDKRICEFSLDDCRLTVFFHHMAKEGINPYSMTEAERYKAAYDYCIEHKDEFDSFVSTSWKTAVQVAEIIICDNTHTTRKSRAKWVQELKQYKFSITMIEVHAPLDVIIERQQTRCDKNVPTDAVISQYYKIEAAYLGVECDSLIVIDGTAIKSEEEWTRTLALA